MNQASIQEQITWGSTLSAIFFVGLSVAFALYIVEIFNEPARKQIRKQKNRRKHAIKEKEYLKKINLDGMNIVEFSKKYEKRLNDDILFKEFNALLSRYRIRNICNKALLRVNEKKNIFEGHIPFEDNYVDIGPKLNNYINASWVPGKESDKMYIITQTPLKNTIRDFWNMIWMYNCSIIVMIGKEIINDKVIIDYLDPSVYTSTKKNSFKIEIEKIQIFSEFIKRIICLHHRNKCRHLIHLQFVTWTHVSVTNAQVILELRRQMRREWLEIRGPIVVHCISGCGRSGTFVTISNMCDLIDSIKESRTDQKISIAYEVINLRESRMLSVANLHQYSMIYETVTHYIVSGITAIHLNDLESEMQCLSFKSSITGSTRFHRQFKNANNRTRKLFITDCAGGFRMENQSKNRLYSITPRDCDRPYLVNILQGDRSDYINAVYVNSFNTKNHFIVTQWPMSNTINDIWRLIFDKSLRTIAVLDVFVQSKTYPAFWPDTLNQSVGFGKVAMKLIKDHLVTSFIRCQVFQLTKLEYRLKDSEVAFLKSKNIQIKLNSISEQWEVMFFHLLNWNSNSSMPENLENVIDFICLIEKYNSLRSQLAKCISPPICIISKDGSERAGVICVMASCLEKIRNSGEIDVYSSVLDVKRNRPKLIPTLEEYLLCYELCLTYQISMKKNRESQNEESVSLDQFVDSSENYLSDENMNINNNENENYGSEINLKMDDN